MDIDKNIPVIFINLEHATERLEKTQKMLNEYGFKNVSRLSAIHNPVVPFIGCAESHLLALKTAKERNYPQVLIMEDDLEILLSPQDFWKKMRRAPFEFDVFQLVAKVFHSEKLSGDELVQIREASNAAGYIVRSHYYDIMIETMKNANILLTITGDHYKYANDRSWIPLQKTGQWYYFNQVIAQQRQNEWSYINNCITSN